MVTTSTLRNDRVVMELYRILVWDHHHFCGFIWIVMAKILSSLIPTYVVWFKGWTYLHASVSILGYGACFFLSVKKSSWTRTIKVQAEAILFCSSSSLHFFSSFVLLTVF